MSRIPYLKISNLVNSRMRLAVLRSVAEEINERKPGACRTWFDVRERGFGSVKSPLSQGFNTENRGTPYEKRRPVWSTFCGAQFRGEKKIHDIDEANIRHSGWYADADCHATVCGIVARLTRGRWMAGYYNSDNCERVYLARVFDDLADAVSEADNEARRVAEKEKEYSERWQAAQALNEKCEEAEKRLRAYLSARNDKRTSARELAEMEIESLRSMRDELANDYADIEI